MLKATKASLSPLKLKAIKNKRKPLPRQSTKLEQSSNDCNTSGLELIRAVTEDLEVLSKRIQEVFPMSPVKSSMKSGTKSPLKVSFGLNTYFTLSLS